MQMLKCFKQSFVFKRQLAQGLGADVGRSAAVLQAQFTAAFHTQTTIQLGWHE